MPSARGERYDVLIVGAGHGGAQTAIALRQLGFTGSIGIVSEEPDPPYERPALSKDYLEGKKPFSRILIRPEDFWAKREITLRLDRRVTAVDATDRRVVLGDGAAIGYDRLVWAAGGTPRRLTCSGQDLTGVHAVRTRADVDQLIRELPNTRRVAVVGGGYIGLEAAAVLTKLGKQVVVIEALPRVLSRVAGEPLSRFYEDEHRRHGVEIRLGCAIHCIEGAGGRASGVRLSDGELLPAELVIVGIGIVPAVQPLLQAGAHGGNGVLVDAMCRTSLADVYAIGDCALHVNHFAGGAAIRIESVQNANDQATVAARAIMGEAVTYDAVPWFWSNQFDLRLQTVGLSIGHDETVLRGNRNSRSFSLIYLREGRVIALDCVNSVKDYVQGRALVQAGAILEPREMADAGVPLSRLPAHGRT